MSSSPVRRFGSFPTWAHFSKPNFPFAGAAGQIGYSLIPIVARGDVFGREQPVIIHLLDIPMMQGVLDGVVMEINDCAFPLLEGVVATTDEATAFKDIDAAFLVGSMPRREGMERKDLLAANVKVRFCSFSIVCLLIDFFVADLCLARSCPGGSCQGQREGAGGGQPSQHERAHLRQVCCTQGARPQHHGHDTFGPEPC